MRLLASITVVAAATTAWSVPPQYFLSDFGIPGTSLSAALDVNGLGDAVGFAENPGAMAQYWQGGSPISLGTLGGATSSARGLNGSGWIVGESATGSGGTEAFLWREGFGMQSLGGIGGTFSSARAVNSGGVVAGTAVDLSGFSNAFVWTEATGMSLLGHLGGGSAGAEDVNDGGTVTGSSVNALGMTEAFVWNEGVGMIGLGSLGGNSIANAISAAGVVVGSANVGSSAGPIRAFRWSLGTGMEELPTLGGLAVASDIADGTGVVGWSRVGSSGPTSAVLWSGSDIVDLNAALAPGAEGWHLENAYGINSVGQIVGRGTVNGESRAFLLTPVPEPATIVALGLGVALLTRRRKRSA